MREVYITGHAHNGLADILNNRQDLDAIIITDYNYPFPEWAINKTRNHINVIFDDTNDDSRHVAPKKEDVQKILDWGKGRDKLVIACHQGRSRSAASAFLLACQDWGDVEEAVQVLKPGIHWPNRLVIKLGSEILKNKRVYKVYEDWINKTYLKLAGMSG